MKPSLILSLIVGVLLSLLVNRIVYFAYITNYSINSFSRVGIKDHYEHDVFKYRILSRYVLFQVDDWLSENMPEKGAPMRLRLYDPKASVRFYLAIYYTNTFFLVLVEILTVLILYIPGAFEMTQGEKSLTIFLVPLIIGLTSYVIVFYDVSSYFFQALILYLFLRMIDKYFLPTLLCIGLLIILSTLNRESSALSVSLLVLLLLCKFGITERSLIAIGAMAGCFLLAYIGLHLLITDNSNITINKALAGKFFDVTNIYGEAFWGIFCYLVFSIANNKENNRMIGFFFFFSTPYILACLFQGILWEMRLYVPLLLGTIFLSKIDTSRNVLSCTDLYQEILVQLRLRKRAPLS